MLTHAQQTEEAAADGRRAPADGRLRTDAGTCRQQQSGEHGGGATFAGPSRWQLYADKLKKQLVDVGAEPLSWTAFETGGFK